MLPSTTVEWNGIRLNCCGRQHIECITKVKQRVDLPKNTYFDTPSKYISDVKCLVISHPNRQRLMLRAEVYMCHWMVCPCYNAALAKASVVFTKEYIAKCSTQTWHVGCRVCYNANLFCPKRLALNQDQFIPRSQFV